MGDETLRLGLTLDRGYAFHVDFGDARLAPLTVDELPPLGEGHGPNPTRLLAAAVAHCLSASALYCLRKARVDVKGMRTSAEATLARDARGRLRVGAIRVRITPVVDAADRDRIGRCLELFEDFCVVTQSVRGGVDVQVEVDPVSSTAAA